jgi:1,2-diacylglycerol-3-alpha-glucose alpha-1,2-glucosyltransferase
MRVLNHLELESRLDRSGMGTAAAQQRKALDAADADVDVVTSPWRRGNALDAAFDHVAFDDDLLAEYDLLHLNMAGPVSLTLAAHANYTDTPLVCHTHVTAEDFRESFRFSNLAAPVLKQYLKRFYSMADLVLCPSEYTKDILESYPVDAPIQPISNGIDVDGLDGHERFRESTRDQYDLDGTVVFAVGNVFERKGLTTFCELAQATDHEFAWFGHYDEGPQASKTTRKWTQNPPANVTFTGWVDDKRMAFGAGDVFCFPAKVENQGLVVLEAMACEKACVLRDIPVFREYFTDGEDAILCETHDEFVDAIDALADDPDRRAELGANARETAREHALDRVGNELVAAYERALDA